MCHYFSFITTKKAFTQILKILTFLVVLISTSDSFAMDLVKTKEAPASKEELKDATYELKLVNKLKEYTHSFLQQVIIDELAKLAAPVSMLALPLDEAAIFKHLPCLSRHFAYKALNANRSQSLFKAREIGELIGAHNMHIFNDTTGRKLEFLFGEALAHRSPAIITFGAPGSQHAGGVARWARLFGMQAICMLRGEEEYPDRDAAYVRQVLFKHAQNGSKLRYTPSQPLHIVATVSEFLLAKQRLGSFPYIIPAGGSNALGFLGLMNMIFDIKDKIAQGAMPKPDIIISGTGADAAGLLYGIVAAKLESRFLTFEIRPEENPEKLFKHVKSRFPWINGLMKEADHAFPDLDFTEKDFEVITGFNVGDYVTEARHLQTRYPNFAGKPLRYVRYWAAIEKYVKQNSLQDKVILVLDTHNDWSAPNYKEENTDLTNFNYKELIPKELHFYFEETQTK